MDEHGKPTEEDLAELLAAITAMEPHFRDVRPKTMQAVWARLPHPTQPSPQEVAEALAWVEAHRGQPDG